MGNIPASFIIVNQNDKIIINKNIGIAKSRKLDLNLFGKDRDKIIKEIKLGPKCTQDEDELFDFFYFNMDIHQ